MFIEILGLGSFLIFLFVDLHQCKPFCFVNFQAPLLCGLGPKLQGPMILTALLTCGKGFELREHKKLTPSGYYYKKKNYFLGSLNKGCMWSLI
jgi:hypothetical protein